MDAAAELAVAGFLFMAAGRFIAELGRFIAAMGQNLYAAVPRAEQTLSKDAVNAMQAVGITLKGGCFCATEQKLSCAARSVASAEGEPPGSRFPSRL